MITIEERKFFTQIMQVFILCVSLIVIVACRDGGGVTSTNREYTILTEDVENVFCFPNPVVNEINQPVVSYTLKNDVNAVTVKIYNTAGALIKNIENLPIKKSAAAYNTQAKWDLTDFSGQKASNGNYIAKFIYKKGENEYAHNINLSVAR